MQQAREQEVAETRATRTAKQVEERFKRAKRDSATGQEEMSCGDMFDVLLFFSRLSGPRHSLELNSPHRSRVQRMSAERKLSDGCKVTSVLLFCHFFLGLPRVLLLLLIFAVPFALRLHRIERTCCN